MHESRTKDQTSGDLSARLAERRTRESFEAKLKEQDDALELADEKRRLLTRIIEFMTSAVCKLGLRRNLFFQIVEQQKFIQGAVTMEELVVISEQLDQFKIEHPEL